MVRAGHGTAALPLARGLVHKGTNVPGDRVTTTAKCRWACPSFPSSRRRWTGTGDASGPRSRSAARHRHGAARFRHAGRVPGKRVKC